MSVGAQSPETLIWKV